MGKFNLAEIEQAEKEGQQDEEEARKRVQEVKDAIVFLKAAEAKPRAVKARLKDTLAEAQKCLAENRLHGNETVRREVWNALINFPISSQISSYDEAESLVSQLIADGLLVKDASGPLTALGKNCRTPEEAMFEKEDIAAIAATLEDFRSRARNAFAGKATKAPNSLLSAVEGDYKLPVPPEKHFSGEKVTWRAGGLILLRLTDGFIVPIDAFGKIASGVYAAHCLGVKLDARFLDNNEPPIVAFDPDDKEGKEKSAATQFIWHLIKRGLRFDLWLRRNQAQATLTSRQFFLEKQAGKYFFDLESWEEGNLKISRLVFSIERLIQDGQSFLRIYSMPSHLEDLLPKTMECYPEGEKFSEIPHQPLQKMLCAMHSKVMLSLSKDEALVQDVIETLN